jgi:predicted phage-related endonuclease
MNSAVINPNHAIPNTATHRPKLFTAKRFVETKNLSQAEWLEVRRQGIGSSDCAAACGLNPYMSMLELWMIKTGRVQQSIEEQSEGHAPLFCGY